MSINLRMVRGVCTSCQEVDDGLIGSCRVRSGMGERRGETSEHGKTRRDSPFAFDRRHHCDSESLCLHTHTHQKRLSILSSCPVSAMATSGDSNQRPAPIPGLSQPSFNTLQFGTMSDSQLRQTINQLSHAASGTQYAYAAPTPQRTAGKRPLLFASFLRIVHHAPGTAYQKNIANWSTSSTPPPRTASRRSRHLKSSNLAPAPATPVTPTPAVPHIQPLAYQPTPTIPPIAIAPTLPADPRNTRPRAPLPTTPQAIQSTYASRLQTGATLLVQPILSGSSAVAAAATSTSTSTRPRRGGVVSYADPGSGDEIPDAGEVDSDGSDFVASGGTRTAIRAARGTVRTVNGVSLYNTGTPISNAAGASSRTELDQSYLGLIPPSRFITAKPFAPTKHGDL